MFEPIVIWDLQEDQDGNYVHIVLENEVSQDEVDDVVGNSSNSTVPSRSTGRTLGRWITFGWTQTGRYIAVVWESVDDDPRTIKPITAYPTEPPAAPKRKRRR